MNISDLLSIGAVVTFVNVVLGYWIKARIEGSIKHEYDRNLEEVKSKWKRTDILYSERLATFKLLQKRLVSLQRYCDAQVRAEQGNEFGSRPDQLDANDNKSILSHWSELNSILGENLIYLSSTSREAFDRLDFQLSMGASMELWLASDDPAPEIVASKCGGYMDINDRVTECINALFVDLDFPSET